MPLQGVQIQDKKQTKKEHSPQAPDIYHIIARMHVKLQDLCDLQNKTIVTWKQ